MRMLPEIKLCSKNLRKRITHLDCPSSKTLGTIRGAYDKFPDFFRMGTFIDSTHMKLSSPSK